jgi:hypothetical protein
MVHVLTFLPLVGCRREESVLYGIVSGRCAIMMKTVRMKCLVFFAAYVLFSAVAVAYDHHDQVQSTTCPICFMRSSLSSAVTQTGFAPHIDNHPLRITSVERIGVFWNKVCTFAVCYRGPPLPQDSFAAHL